MNEADATRAAEASAIVFYLREVRSGGVSGRTYNHVPGKLERREDGVLWFSPLDKKDGDGWPAAPLSKYALE